MKPDKTVGESTQALLRNAVPDPEDGKITKAVMAKIRSGEAEKQTYPKHGTIRRISAVCGSLAAVLLIAVGLYAALPYLNGISADSARAADCEAAEENSICYAVEAEQTDTAAENNTVVSFVRKSDADETDAALSDGTPTECAEAEDIYNEKCCKEAPAAYDGNACANNVAEELSVTTVYVFCTEEKTLSALLSDTPAAPYITEAGADGSVTISAEGLTALTAYLDAAGIAYEYEYGTPAGDGDTVQVAAG